MVTAPSPRVIAGFGRSGTTWVQDVLAEANSMRAVFEPLHPEVISLAGEFAHAYRSADDEDARLYEFLDRYFNGEFHSLWVDYRVRADLLIPGKDDLSILRRIKTFLRRTNNAQKNLRRYRKQRRNRSRITKLIRANMMLSWLKEKFGARIVFLIRHPGAVVISQYSSIQRWNPDACLQRYRADPRILEEAGPGAQRIIDDELSDIEKLTLSWCIENSIALSQSRNAGIPVIFYEDLIEHGDREWGRILSELDLKSRPDKALICRPSQQTWTVESRSPGTTPRHAVWMNRIEPGVAEKIQGVLDRFEFDLYQMDNLLPATDAKPN